MTWTSALNSIGTTDLQYGSGISERKLSGSRFYLSQLFIFLYCKQQNELDTLRKYSLNFSKINVYEKIFICGTLPSCCISMYQK